MLLRWRSVKSHKDSTEWNVIVFVESSFIILFQIGQALPFKYQRYNWNSLVEQKKVLLYSLSIHIAESRESNRLIFPVQVRFGFNSGFKFRFSSGYGSDKLKRSGLGSLQ